VADLGSLVVRLALMGAAEFREDMKRASAAVESFQSSAADFAEQARASFGGQVLETMVRFGAEAVTAFLEAEKGSQRLELAVSRVNGVMPGFAGHLEEVADAVERATGVDGDYVKSLQQLALELQVAPALVDRTTKAALDWAAATGGSAKSAMQLLTTATAENLDQLQRWGVRVDEAEVKSRGLTAVLEQFEKVYGGTSAQMHEASKSIALNKAAWGDLKEAIGETITGMLHFSGVAGAAAASMDVLTEALSSKKAEEVGRYREQTAALTAATERYVNAVERLKDVEGELAGLTPGTWLYERTAESVQSARDGVVELEMALERLQGKDMSPTKHDFSASGLDLRPDMKALEDANRAQIRLADEAYERFSRAAEKGAEYATSVDARTASLAGQQDSAGFQAAMGVQAAELEASALIENMNAEMAKADAALAGATISADAQGAAAAFEKLYQDAKDFAQSAETEAQRAKDALVNRALGSLGKLGGIIQNAAAAAAGGPLAVLASIVMDVLMQSETFQRIVATLNGILKVVADTLGQLLEPLLPLVGAVGLLITAIMPLAAMLIELAVGVVEPLTPIIVLVSTILQALMPVITVLAEAFLMIMNPLMVIAGPVLKALFDVLKGVAIIILYVAKAIGDAWNWIIGAIQSVFRFLEDVPLIGGAMGDLADSLEGAKVDTEAMAKAISELTGLSYELALAKAKEAQASFENAQATKKLTDLNTPERWKKFLRTGEAADPQAPPAPPGSMPPGTAPPTAPAPGAPPGGGGLPPILSNGPIGGVFDVANDVLSGGRTPGGQSTLGNVLNIVNNVVVNGANSDAVLAEAEQRGYLTNQRTADSSVGTPVRIGPFQLSLG
jgi:hypothetical protein